MSARKAYIGDGVYVDLYTDHEMSAAGDLVLTTENGIGVTNRIILEPEVLENLLRYVAAQYSKEAILKAVQS